MQQVLGKLSGLQRLLREAGAAALAGLLAGNTQTADAGSTLTTLRLGDTPVSLRTRQSRQGGLCYLSLHENEQTAVQAAADLLLQQPGQLIELRARGRRFVTFRSGLRPYAFDPNRIFTEAGMVQTLQRYASTTPFAQAALCTLRDAVLALIAGPPDQPVVALHNNGAGRYSILQYQAGGDHAGDAQALAVDPHSAPEDFFVVTRAGLFEALCEQGFNVVLQSDQPADDGSLSVWFGQQRRAYVNVEARHGHLAQQRRMLAAVAGSWAGHVHDKQDC